MRRFVPCLAAMLAILPAPALADATVSASASAAVDVSPLKAAAQQRSDRLDELFARLHRAKTSDAAQGPEHDIWVLWMTSDSATADALLAQAARAMNDNAFAPARQILDKMVTLYPNYAEVWNKRATLNFLTGRLDDSLADIEHVLAIEPRHFGALSGKGLVLEQQKKYSAALDAFHEALAINPNMTSIQNEISRIEKTQRAI
jgi:tetratricopeptide (TPR) repeat protein